MFLEKEIQNAEGLTKSITKNRNRKKLLPLILEEIGRNDLQRIVLQYVQKGNTDFFVLYQY